jgi:F-type H+-transporting ATPase subunit gamma
MAQTRVLVKRRKAIRNIRKITRTMELIATSRFKKAMDRASQAEAYTRKIAEMAADLSATVTEIKHPLLEKRDQIKTSQLLVIGSNRGLCGGYNGGVIREAMPRLRQQRAEGVAVNLDLSGKRIIAYFRYHGETPEHRYTQFEDKPVYHEVEEIADRYLADYIAGKIDRVEVAYQKFLSAGRQVPVVETLLPLAAAAETRTEAKPPTRTVEYEFYPSAADILHDLLPVSFKVRLFKCFLDAAVSEQIARRVTMKAATDNADDMIKSITLKYNRARQAAITKEIAEVIGGAAGLE